MEFQPPYSLFLGKGLKLSNSTATQNGSGGEAGRGAEGSWELTQSLREGGHHTQAPLSNRGMLWRGGRAASDSVLKNRLLGVSGKNAYSPAWA